MAVSEDIKIKAMVACGRRCCVCHKFCGNNMEVHHIKAHADGGADVLENLLLEWVKKRAFYFFFTHFEGQNMLGYGKIYEEKDLWSYGENTRNIRKNQAIPS